ncbi:hypothetical protein GQR58_015405 [Nymphon striatum]|nr:hypothetical protein GQR58_015405 [Nymphon striatum]
MMKKGARARTEVKQNGITVRRGPMSDVYLISFDAVHIGKAVGEIQTDLLNVIYSAIGGESMSLFFKEYRDTDSTISSGDTPQDTLNRFQQSIIDPTTTLWMYSPHHKRKRVDDVSDSESVVSLDQSLSSTKRPRTDRQVAPSIEGSGELLYCQETDVAKDSSKIELSAPTMQGDDVDIPHPFTLCSEATAHENSAKIEDLPELGLSTSGDSSKIMDPVEVCSKSPPIQSEDTAFTQTPTSFDEVVPFMDANMSDEPVLYIGKKKSMKSKNKTNIQPLIKEFLLPEAVLSPPTKQGVDVPVRSKSTGKGKAATLNMSTISGDATKSFDSPFTSTDPSPADTISEDIYDISERSARYIKRFGVTERNYELKFKDSWYNQDFVEIMMQLYVIFEELIEKVTKDLDKTDLIRIYINHKSLQTPIALSLRPVGDLDAQSILDCIDKILQSSKTLTIDSSLEIVVGVIQRRGGASHYLIHGTDDACIKDKSSIVSITVKDNLCLARAIVVGVAALRDKKLYEKTNSVAGYLRNRIMAMYATPITQKRMTVISVFLTS